MIYVGDIGTEIRITFDGYFAGTKFEKLLIYTSYDNSYHKVNKNVIDTNPNLIAFTLPKIATLKHGHIYFKVFTNKGTFKTKIITINDTSKKHKIEAQYYKIIPDDINLDDYFLIN